MQRSKRLERRTGRRVAKKARGTQARNILAAVNAQLSSTHPESPQALNHEVQPVEPAMSEKSYPSPLPIIAILAILLLLVGGYVGAYLGVGVRVDWRTPSGVLGTIERTYTHQWMLILFAPAAWAETKMRDVQVQAVYVSPEYQQRLQKRRGSSLPNSQAPTPNPSKK